MLVGHHTTSVPKCGLHMGLSRGELFHPRETVPGETYNSYTIIPAVDGREGVVGRGCIIGGRLVNNPHIQTMTGVGRLEAIGGHSTEGMQEESRKRYGKSARKGRTATSELALTRNSEAPGAGGVARARYTGSCTLKRPCQTPFVCHPCSLGLGLCAVHGRPLLPNHPSQRRNAAASGTAQC